MMFSVTKEKKFAYDFHQNIILKKLTGARLDALLGETRRYCCLRNVRAAHRYNKAILSERN